MRRPVFEDSKDTLLATFPDEQDIALLDENTALIKSFFNELSELRDYNQSLSDQIYGFQSESAQKEAQIKALLFEKAVILEENVALQNSVRDSEVEFAVERIIDRTFGEFAQPVIGLAALHRPVAEPQPLRVQVPAHVVVIRLRPLGVRQRHHHTFGQLRFHFRVIASVAAILGLIVITFGASRKPAARGLIVHPDRRQSDECQNADDPPATR